MAGGATGWTLLGLDEPGKERRLIIWDTQDVTLGRADDNDVVLEDTDASRHHVKFTRLQSSWTVEDLNTSNGTKINGEPLGAPHTLQNKDAIEIGELKITFIRTAKDPTGLKVSRVYASELKGFAGGAAPDPGSTTLGLVDPASGIFEVDSVGSFGAPSVPKDLDDELGGFVREDDTLSMTLELHGLSADMRNQLRALFGKVIDLPALKIKIKGE